MARSTPWYYMLDGHVFSYLFAAAHTESYMFSNAVADLCAYTGDLRDVRWIEGICAEGLTHAGDAGKTAYSDMAYQLGLDFAGKADKAEVAPCMSDVDPSLHEMLSKAALIL